MIYIKKFGNVWKCSLLAKSERKHLSYSFDKKLRRPWVAEFSRYFQYTHILRSENRNYTSFVTKNKLIQIRIRLYFTLPADVHILDLLDWTIHWRGSSSDFIQVYILLRRRQICTVYTRDSS